MLVRLVQRRSSSSHVVCGEHFLLHAPTWEVPRHVERAHVGGPGNSPS